MAASENYCITEDVSKRKAAKPEMRSSFEMSASKPPDQSYLDSMIASYTTKIERVEAKDAAEVEAPKGARAKQVKDMHGRQ